MQFKFAYLTALSKNDPKGFMEMRRNGTLDAHVQAKAEEAYALVDQMLAHEPRHPHGTTKDPQAQRLAEEWAMALMLEFPNEDHHEPPDDLPMPGSPARIGSRPSQRSTRAARRRPEQDEDHVTARPLARSDALRTDRPEAASALQTVQLLDHQEPGRLERGANREEHGLGHRTTARAAALTDAYLEHLEAVARGGPETQPVAAAGVPGDAADGTEEPAPHSVLAELDQSPEGHPSQPPCAAAAQPDALDEVKTEGSPRPPPAFGDTNKIFTRERAEAARERIKARLIDGHRYADEDD